MVTPKRPTIGLALGGSGSRTSFYIGFLEIFDQAKIPIDYITASSGGSMVAAAYACGTLHQLKDFALSLDNDSIKQYVSRGRRGGFYSLDGMEQKIREFTGGKNFEDVRPIMSFVTVDIENGEQVNLCMGDIAKACRVSCTLPGVFEPVKWGTRTLVDGGLLNLVPVNALKEFSVDLTIGVDIPGTKFIFSGKQMTLRKAFNLIKKMLFINVMEEFLNGIFGQEEVDFEQNPSYFTVLGKSIDLAIKANKNLSQQDLQCDLLISPKIPYLKPTMFFQFNPYYEMGKQCALEHIPEIKKLILKKQEDLEKIFV